MINELPQYKCLLKAAEQYPSLDLTANEAFLYLQRTRDMLIEEIDRVFARHKVGRGCFAIMLLLNRPLDEPCTLASLARELGVTRPTMTGLIDTLEKDGLAERQADTHDRRFMHVSLTERGLNRLNAMVPDCFQCISKMMRPLNHREHQQLVRLLQKLQGGLIAPCLENNTRQPHEKLPASDSPRKKNARGEQP